MLCTKQKVLRRFWYATVPVDKLDDGPKPFTLLGEKIVLFLDGDCTLLPGWIDAGVRALNEDARERMRAAGTHTCSYRPLSGKDFKS